MAGMGWRRIGSGSSGSDEGTKGDLQEYLRGACETLVWKLDGLGEYDVRRPMTPTGTNLLGLVKHQATTHVSYFCKPFGRGHELSLPWMEREADPEASLWATPEESRDQILDLFWRTYEVADAAITELPLATLGSFPSWGLGTKLTLQRVVVHVTAEAQRHAGHADIIRELIDDSAGMLQGHPGLRSDVQTERGPYRDKVEAAAIRASE
jgi:hypothetical protein